MAPKHFLNNLTIPTPCSADWNSMIGNDQVRFCEHCNLDVHNLSLMTRNQAQRLVARSNGRLCVRYHCDPEGGPRTLPIPQKLHLIGRRASKLAAGAFSVTLSVTSAVAYGSQNHQSGYSNAPGVAQPGARWGLGSSIVGTITDQNGAVIPSGAPSYYRTSNCSLALYASTSFSGQFRIESLQAGVYNLRIEAPGFAAEQMEGVYVRANGEVRVDRTLRVATIEENVDSHRFRN